MKHTLNFVPPMPGEQALFYCPNCKSSFSGMVLHQGPFNILLGIRGPRSKCPVCKKLCGLDPKIQY